MHFAAEEGAAIEAEEEIGVEAAVEELRMAGEDWVRTREAGVEADTEAVAVES